ncbi:MAG: hypothetical protein GWP04_11650 [Gammaproteobacteria bacterium]|nr:hypothetical protein [Gammaproteobacteria bacterium]
MQISNLILQVSDMERSLHFYQDVLELPLLHASGAFAFLDGGGVTLALNEYPGEFPAIPSVAEIVLQVDDVHEVYRTLADRGVEFRVEPRVVTEMDGRQLLAADFRDPDGHVLSITGWG